MTSITWAGPKCVQEAAAILGPQNRIQGRCGVLFARGGGWEMGGEDRDCGVINLLISGNITPTYRREENTSDGVQLRPFGRESHNISVRQLLFRPFCANDSCNCK